MYSATVAFLFLMTPLISLPLSFPAERRIMNKTQRSLNSNLNFDLTLALSNSNKLLEVSCR